MSGPLSGDIYGKRVVVMETRRAWSADERRRILDETVETSVSAVARKHAIAKNLLFRWRKLAGMTRKRAASNASPAAFLAVKVIEHAAPFTDAVTGKIARAKEVRAAPVKRSSCSGMVEIELLNRHKLRVSGEVDGARLKQIVAALGG